MQSKIIATNHSTGNSAQINAADTPFHRGASVVIGMFPSADHSAGNIDVQESNVDPSGTPSWTDIAGAEISDNLPIFVNIEMPESLRLSTDTAPTTGSVTVVLFGGT